MQGAASIKTIAQRTTCPRIAGGAKTTRDALRPDVELRQCVRAQTIQCGGVCATRLGSDLTTYRLEMACTTTRTLPECNCHCFPCLLCVAPFGDMHSRRPPPPLGVA